MKLLFDENLSPSLVTFLSDLFPDSIHVRDCGLQSSPDSAVWDHALNSGYIIVSKDADFRQRISLSSSSPKIIWIRLGNCSTRQIADLLRRYSVRVKSFFDSENQSFLSLG